MQKIVKVKIEGMHCVSCEKIISMELEELPGITSVKVSSSEGQAIVKADSSLKTETILSTIKKAGYGAELTEEKNETE